jgi:hypothetical protein
MLAVDRVATLTDMAKQFSPQERRATLAFEDIMHAVFNAGVQVTRWVAWGRSLI